MPWTDSTSCSGVGATVSLRKLAIWRYALFQCIYLETLLCDLPLSFQKFIGKLLFFSLGLCQLKCFNWVSRGDTQLFFQRQDLLVLLLQHLLGLFGIIWIGGCQCKDLVFQVFDSSSLRSGDDLLLLPPPLHFLSASFLFFIDACVLITSLCKTSETWRCRDILSLWLIKSKFKTMWVAL